MKSLLLFLAVIYALMSGVTYLAYARDKSAAIRHERRTPERTLHVLALLGGWPGAWIAQETLRHKTAKQRFRIMFWITIVGNMTGLWFLVTTPLF